MNEHGFIRSVHRQLPDFLYKWKINDNFQGGVADAYYSGKGGDLWVEYKYLPALPKRMTTKLNIGLTGQQIVWLNARHDEGRHVAVVVGTPQGHRILVAKAWSQAISNSEFISSAIATSDVAAYIVKHTTTAETSPTHAHHHSRRPGSRTASQRDLEQEKR